ncbi:hypothetical protein [Azospirillum argentinense]
MGLCYLNYSQLMYRFLLRLAKGLRQVFPTIYHFPWFQRILPFIQLHMLINAYCIYNT